MISRRHLLRGGALTMAIAGTGLGYRAADQGVLGVGHGSAYALWDTWDRTGGIEPVVAAGLLAANAHDSQPWHFRVDLPGAAGRTPREAVVEVFREPERHIGSVDSFRREMHISLGCAVENIAVTARARGWDPTVTLLPRDGGPDLVARVELERGRALPGELAEAVGRRHTNRYAYQDRPVAPVLLGDLDDAVADIEGVRVRWLTDRGDLDTFREQTLAATKALTRDDQMSADSHAWQQHSWSQMQETAAGLTYDSTVSNPALVAAAKVLPELGVDASNEAFVRVTRMHVDTAPLAGIITADPALADDPTAAPEAWLRAGRLWQRLHLAMTVHDLAAQPLNQLAELTDRERQLDGPTNFGDVLTSLAGPDAAAMMPFRLGHPTKPATPTPRRPLARVVDYT